MGVSHLALCGNYRPDRLSNVETMLRIKYLIALLAVLVIVAVIPELSDVQAQCPMCRMSAESNLANGGTAGKGLNRGILYMLAMPYLLVGTLGFVWWKNSQMLPDEQEVQF